MTGGAPWGLEFINSIYTKTEERREYNKRHTKKAWYGARHLKRLMRKYKNISISISINSKLKTSYKKIRCIKANFFFSIQSIQITVKTLNPNPLARFRKHALAL